MKAARAVLELIRDEGVEHVFGNPGTTELPLLEALTDAPDFRYVLGLHEAVAVSMADGYARATGRPSFVNLHIAAGLANGLSNVLNARRARTPMVVTAGQQDRRHLIQDPMLGGDLVAIAQGSFKDAIEVNRVEDLPTLLRRAFLISNSPPAGPVFLSIPIDLLEEELPGAVPPASAISPLGPATNVAELARTLNAAHSPAIVAGDGVGRDGAVGQLVQVAERLGATVFQEPMYDTVDFPATHPLCAGMLAPVNAEIRRALEPHDVVFLVGSHAFSAHYYTPGPAIPPSTTLLQLDSDPTELGRNYPVSCGLHGGVRETLEVLLPLLDRRRRPADGQGSPPTREETSTSTLTTASDLTHPTEAARALVDALPDGTVLIDEAITTGLAIRKAFAAERPGSYHHSVGGALGWGIGAAAGVKLARPDLPVVAVLGDGSAMYAIQGLWSAARYELPILVVVLNNGEYRACKQGVEKVVAGGPSAGFLGMDLAAPSIDFRGLACALGVADRRAESPEAIAHQVEGAIASGKPTLLEIPIAGMDES